MRMRAPIVMLLINAIAKRAEIARRDWRISTPAAGTVKGGLGPWWLEAPDRLIGHGTTITVMALPSPTSRLSVRIAVAARSSGKAWDSIRRRGNSPVTTH